MSTWIALDTQAAVTAFMEAFDGFHDSCLRQVLLSTETCVEASRGMQAPGHRDTSVRLFLQSQGAREPAVELRCEGVVLFRITPTGDNQDSIVTACEFDRVGEGVRLGLFFMGLPILGPANGAAHRHIGADEPPAVEVIARRMAWRAVPGGLGPALVYRTPEDSY